LHPQQVCVMHTHYSWRAQSCTFKSSR
jgi:hypothetical protein